MSVKFNTTTWNEVWNRVAGMLGDYLVKSDNLSDLPSAPTARSNLGLGTAALESYEEGTWTPAFTFSTPGNLNIAYSDQVGTYTAIGNLVRLNFYLNTSTFTHTTASGAALLTGLPFAAASLAYSAHVGSLRWGGITRSDVMDLSIQLGAGQSIMSFPRSATAQLPTGMVPSWCPTGGTLNLLGALIYTRA